MDVKYKIENINVSKDGNCVVSYIIYPVDYNSFGRQNNLAVIISVANTLISECETAIVNNEKGSYKTVTK